MLLTDRFSLIVLGLTLGAQLMRRSFLVHSIKYIWRIAALGYFVLSVYWSWALYEAWQGNSLMRFVLPPYNSDWNYYISKVAVDIFGPWVIALVVGVAFGLFAHYMNARSGERFFEKEEIPILALGIFLTGYPGFLFYIFFVLFAAIFQSLYYTARGKGRAPLYYFWLPLAILAIIIKNWLLPQDFLSQFKL